MKKAIVAAMCFMLVSFLLVSGTFAMPDLNQVFADLTDTLLGEILGKPQQDTTNKVKVSLVSTEEAPHLYPGGAASRTSYVRNEGEGPICFRVAYAVQYDEATAHLLTTEFDASEGFVQESSKDIKIDGTPYRMTVFTYPRILAPGDESPKITVKITMDAAMTSAQLANYRSDFLQMQAMAVDPTPFMNSTNERKSPVAADATEVLNLALPLGTLNPF